jgi:formate-dependent nitrite reductase membrane component NrfD
MNMLRVVKLKSPMSLGSWALTGVGAAAMAEGVLQLASDLAGHTVVPRLRRAIGIAGLPFSIFLSGYTGVLLSATNVPLWWRSFPLLSPTFVSSAYSTTLAALSAGLQLSGHENEDTAHKLARAETICLATEITGLTLVLLRLGSLGKPLRTGTLGRVFWPVTYVGGLVVPLALHLTGPAAGRETTSRRRWTAAGLALLGGLSLRALMIFAGRESARRPEDYFALTGGIRSEQ